MQIVNKGKRKAISPVLATVILIAITLIAAIAIAGFVFGLFGSFTSSATVSVQVQTCAVTGLVCTLTVSNSGTASASISANTCTVNLAGVPVKGTNALT